MPGPQVKWEGPGGAARGAPSPKEAAAGSGAPGEEAEGGGPPAGEDAFSLYSENEGKRRGGGEKPHRWRERRVRGSFGPLTRVRPERGPEL